MSKLCGGGFGPTISLWPGAEGVAKGYSLGPDGDIVYAPSIDGADNAQSRKFGPLWAYVVMSLCVCVWRERMKARNHLGIGAKQVLGRSRGQTPTVVDPPRF